MKMRGMEDMKKKTKMKHLDLKNVYKWRKNPKTINELNSWLYTKIKDKWTEDIANNNKLFKLKDKEQKGWK